MFIGTLFSDRVDRDNPIDLRFHRNLETSTRKFLEIHLKLSESENADRAIGNQISDINLEMLPKEKKKENSFLNLAWYIYLKKCCLYTNRLTSFVNLHLYKSNRM